MNPEKENGPQGWSPEGRSDDRIATKQIRDERIAPGGQPAATDVVTVPRWLILELLADAQAWRDYWMPEAVAERLEQFEQEKRRALREMQWDLAGSPDDRTRAVDWQRVASAPSYAELERRRNEYPPLRPAPDPEAVARWVATGSSEPEEAAA